MRKSLLLLLALGLTACGGNGNVSAAGEVEDLANVLELRSDFEADAGKTRAIVLLSPT